MFKWIKFNRNWTWFEYVKWCGLRTNSDSSFIQTAIHTILWFIRWSFPLRCCVDSSHSILPSITTTKTNWMNRSIIAFIANERIGDHKNTQQSNEIYLAFASTLSVRVRVWPSTVRSIMIQIFKWEKSQGVLIAEKTPTTHSAGEKAS